MKRPEISRCNRVRCNERPGFESFTLTVGRDLSLCTGRTHEIEERKGVPRIEQRLWELGISGGSHE